jgi:hypothetical protein
MRRTAARANLAGILILIWLVLTAFNMWQRFDQAQVKVEVWNLTAAKQTVRVTDGTSGRDVGTFVVDGNQASVLVNDRLDVWYRDLTLTERALRRSNHFVVELLADDRCELVDRQQVDHDFQRIDIVAGGLTMMLDEQPPKPDVAGRVLDPCAGEAATPRGVVANMTKEPIIVGAEVRMAPCSTRVIRAGDLIGSVPPAGSPATRVRVPSMEAQDEQWPLEPRTVVVSSHEILDEIRGGFEVGEFGPCGGAVPDGAVIGGSKRQGR